MSHEPLNLPPVGQQAPDVCPREAVVHQINHAFILLGAYHAAGGLHHLLQAGVQVGVVVGFAVVLSRCFILTLVINESRVLDHLLSVLGETVFDDLVAAGAAMEPGDAVRYARQQIELVRAELVGTS